VATEERLLPEDVRDPRSIGNEGSISTQARLAHTSRKDRAPAEPRMSEQVDPLQTRYSTPAAASQLTKEALSGRKQRASSSSQEPQDDNSMTVLRQGLPPLPPHLVGATPNLAGIPLEISSMIYENLSSHADLRTLRRVCKKINTELSSRDVTDDTVCVTPYPPSIREFWALARDPIKRLKVTKIIFVDLRIRDGDELPDEMFYDLNEPEAILYKEEWRRDWHKYRSEPTTAIALSNPAR
jgi:hypothetical protein